MMRAALYARVSTQEQGSDDRNSLPVQREMFAARCIERGYRAMSQFVDVMSGARADREQYQAMLSAARKGEFDVLVFTYFDRFGRDDWEIMASVGELRRLKIELDPIHESADKFIEVALSAWKAAEERERISERVSSTMTAAARRGVALGRPPYGYVKQWDTRLDGKPINHRLVPYEPQAVWVKQAFEWYAEGNLSLREIAQRFSDASPPKANGSRFWWPGEIKKLLRRRRYLGEFTWRVSKTGENVTALAAHPPIIELELFEAVQRRLAVKATVPTGRTQRSDYLLSGLIRCAHCQGPMHGSATRAQPGRRNVTTRLYICSRHRKQRTCEYPNNHEAGRVEAAVLNTLSEIVGDIEAVSEGVTSAGDRHRERLAEVARELSQVGERFLANLDMYERRVIASEDQLAAANQRLAEQQQRLRDEQRHLERAVAGAEERQQATRELPAQVKTLTGRLDRMSVAEQKSLLQQLVARVEMREGDQEPVVYLRVLSD